MNVHGERFFLLGIGGMGMLPLALFLKEGGAEVEGWDDSLTPRSERLLRAWGVSLVSELNSVIPCAFLVVSSAIAPDHPVRVRLEANDPVPVVLRRGELLARIAAGRKLLAVAGSHGKTTTTALLAYLAEREGWEADYVIGGLPGDGLPPARNRGAKWLVAEIDESDGTIDGFFPAVSLFLNFDWDHADRYRDVGSIQATWAGLARRTRMAVVHPETTQRDSAPEWPSSVQQVAFPVAAGDFLATDESAARTAFAVAAGRAANSDALEGFPGVWRRQTIHAGKEGFAIVEDYAHHPREVAAFLDWLSLRDFPKPLRVYFQPHRFSRTARFAGEFVEALSGLTEVGLHSVYGAGEAAGSSGDALGKIQEGLEARGVRVARIGGLADFPGFAGGGNNQPEGTFAFVGAGDANEWAAVLAALAEEGGHPASALLRLATTTLAAGTVRGGEPLGRYSTLRIGGRAAVFAEPDGVPSLRWLLRTARMLGVPVAILGNGSNLLVADEGFDGLVLRMRGSAWEFADPGESFIRIVAGAGCNLSGLARLAAKRGLAGFEFLEGIPGTVGGGLRMNAGAMGGWIGDLAVEVDALDRSGNSVHLKREDLSFGYRSCPQLEALCIIRAVFESRIREDPEVIRERMRTFAIRRRASQPGGASAGCLFRNPGGDSAGRLIESAGLKGYRLGRVSVSEKHANFILSEKDASAADVLAVLREIRERVRLRDGLLLEPEVRFLAPGNPGILPPPVDPFPTVSLR